MRNQTNEKLSRVKLLLAPLQAASDPNLVEAFAEAVLLELGLAYRCFLTELAVEHGVAPQAVTSATDLAAALTAQQSCVAEVDELAHLESERGWPHTLLAAAQARSQAAPKQTSTQVKNNLINVLQVDEKKDDKLNYSDCSEIYQALRSSVEHQRNMAQEW